jgi:hypothetical protein
VSRLTTALHKSSALYTLATAYAPFLSIKDQAIMLHLPEAMKEMELQFVGLGRVSRHTLTLNSREMTSKKLPAACATANATIEYHATARNAPALFHLLQPSGSAGLADGAGRGTHFQIASKTHVYGVVLLSRDVDEGGT